MLRRSVTVGLLLALSSCSSDAKKPETTHPDAVPNLDDVIYIGGTTDEALEHLVGIQAKDDPTQYVIIDAPDLDEPLAADAPSTFEYHLASQAVRAPVLPAAPPAWQRPLREVLKLLGPPRVAYAHGTPLNGTAYFLRIVDADGEPLAQVFTSKTSYAPDAATWQTWVEAKQPLSFEVTSAFFENDDIPSDGGPYIGGSFEFSIE